MRLTPVECAVFAFGTPAALARAICAPKSAPFDWQKPRLTRGDPGDIPVPQIRRILEVARERGLALTALELLYGREVAEPVVLELASV